MDKGYIRLCEAFQYVDDEFLDIVEREKRAGKEKVKKPVRMLWGTVAACICMLIILPAAALAYNWFGLKDLLLPVREKQPDSFSLSAYRESPAYQAAAEWKAFLAEYDVDRRILFEAEKTGFTVENESWKLHGVYSQEMGEMLDAIAERYELRLHTGGRMIKRILWEPLVTESFLAGSSTEDGFLYEDSSFLFAGSIELAGYGRVEFDFVYAVKGSFLEALPIIGDVAEYQELHYETAGGEPVLFALGSREALILAEAERYLAVVAIPCGTDDGITEEVLQELADRIDFYTLWGIHMSELSVGITSGDMISLSGYQESPEAKALAEWQAFRASYDTDGKILSAIGNGVFVAEGREDWGQYGGVYSYEMGEKLDEIADKYGLKLHTQCDVINPQELEYRVGGSFLRDCTMYWGYIYENGTFHTECDAELEGCGLTDFQFDRSVKGTFEEAYLNIGRVEEYTEWQYLSAGGETVLLALSPVKALIFADFEECFITVNVLLGSDDGMTEEDLQELADRIDFGVLKDVQVPDMRGDSVLEEEINAVESTADNQFMEVIDRSRIDDQSFEVVLNEWGKVTFVSCMPDFYDENLDPLTDASFYLLKNEKVLYRFPYVSENNIRETGLCEGVSFVFFEDINEDNKDEIVIGVLYVSGAGPQGMIPYTEIRIYEDGGNEFVYNENLSDEMNEKLTDEVTAEYVKTLLKE